MQIFHPKELATVMTISIECIIAMLFRAMGVRVMLLFCSTRSRNVSRELLLEWCRDNSVVWENPVRENTTHYTVEYTCKAVLVVSYHAVGYERTCI